MTLDPAKTKYPAISPYTAFVNNPNLFNDVNGDTIKITIIIKNHDETTTEVRVLSETEVAELVTNELVFSPRIYGAHGGLFEFEDVVQGEYDVNIILTFDVTNAQNLSEVMITNKTEYTYRKKWYEKLLGWSPSGGENYTSENGGGLEGRKGRMVGSQNIDDLMALLDIAGGNRGSGAGSFKIPKEFKDTEGLLDAVETLTNTVMQQEGIISNFKDVIGGIKNIVSENKKKESVNSNKSIDNEDTGPGYKHPSKK